MAITIIKKSNPGQVIVKDPVQPPGQTRVCANCKLWKELAPEIAKDWPKLRRCEKHWCYTPADGTCGSFIGA